MSGAFTGAALPARAQLRPQAGLPPRAAPSCVAGLTDPRGLQPGREEATQPRAGDRPGEGADGPGGSSCPRRAPQSQHSGAQARLSAAAPPTVPPELGAEGAHQVQAGRRWPGHGAARRPEPGLRGDLEQVTCSSHRAGCPAHHGHETRQVSSGLCGCLGNGRQDEEGPHSLRQGDARPQGPHSLHEREAPPQGPALTPRGGGPAPGPALTPQGRTGRRPRLRSCSRCARSAHTGPARTGRTPPSRPRRARTTSRLSTPPQPGLCGRNTGQSNGDREPWRGGRPSPPGGQRAALLQRLTHRQSICAEALRLDPFTRAPGQLRPTWNCHHPEVGSPG